MPIMDGYEATIRLRAMMRNGDLANVHILGSTA